MSPNITERMIEVTTTAAAKKIVYRISHSSPTCLCCKFATNHFVSEMFVGVRTRLLNRNLLPLYSVRIGLNGTFIVPKNFIIHQKHKVIQGNTMSLVAALFEKYNSDSDIISDHSTIVRCNIK